MDAITDPRYPQVTVKKSARVGWTKILNWTIAYHMKHDPCPMLLVQPTIEDAKGYSQDELEPMLRDMAALKGLVTDSRKRDSKNTTLKKSFPGGRLYLIGAESARGFRRITTRVNLYDELSGWKVATKEGDQEKLARRRTQTFWNRKELAGSTPTNKGECRISKRYEQSDKRVFEVPCPICGEMQTLKFRNLKWPDGLEWAYFQCEFCSKPIEHSKKRWMCERGVWKATQPQVKDHAGFFIWAAYSFSPNADWSDIAKEWADAAHSRDREQIRTVVNTLLGEEFVEQQTEDLESLKGRLIARREDYGCDTIIRETGEVVPPKWVVPMNAGAVLIACDVQDDRIEAMPVAWGEGEECWPLSLDIFYGHTAVNAPGGPWEQLDIYLMKVWQHENLVDSLRPELVFIDSSHLRAVVGEFTKPRTPRQIFAIRGSSEPKHELVSGQKTDKKNRIPTYYIGTNTAKDMIHQRLQLEHPGPGYIHFNKRFDDEFFRQLVMSEYRDPKTRTWKKKTANDPNEGLDLMVYSIAAWHRFIKDTGFDIGAKVQELKKRAGIQAAYDPPPRGPQVRRRIISKGVIE